MTREEFNKNSYLVNNNALYNKHTEHISTTEPIFIDGMAGSDNIVHEREGDASQNTYWAYEYESGKFMLGKFNEDDIKVKCETDSSDLWIVDAEGVYIEQDALNSYMESDCLDAINAKYGTNFSTLTMQKVKSIDIGETMPNWNAYEKISNIIYIKRNGPAIAGYIKDDTGYIYTKNSICYIFDLESGEVTSVTGPQLNDSLKNPIIGWAGAAGFTISQVEPKEENFEIGQSMQNWNNYVTI